LSTTHGPAGGYAGLTPDRVLDALAAGGLQPDGRLLQLNSYENRVYQAYLDDGPAVVAKFYRAGRWSDAQILEEHAFAQELAAADVPVVAPAPMRTTAADLQVTGAPPTLARNADGSLRFSISPCWPGRAPDLDDPAVMAWLGRFLGRLHAVGARQPFRHRRRLDVATYGDASRRLLLDGGFVDLAQQAAWRDACDRALDLAQRAFERVDGLRTLRLHGDCHPGNILWREGEGDDRGPHVVDLDDACTGPAMQDLWMLLPDAAQAPLQRQALLDGYRLFMTLDERELRLAEPLRTLRMLHHSAWIAQRWDDPAFPIAFPWFGTPAYWSQQVTQLREQVEAMAAAA
jgi:Ser/Thr protein kinase RdoA (MazF antagonist)